MRCAICGRDGAEKLFDIPYLPPYRVLRCPGCDAAFTAPPVPEAEIVRHYPDAYYGDGGRKFNALIELLVYLSRVRRARRILRYVPRGRILDVGCGGREHFLEYMSRLGWEVHGNELVESRGLRELGKKGVRVQIRDFLKADYPPASFDVLVFWHVLEHMPRPAEALDKARSLLKPGGLLVLALPNRGSGQARWAGPHWFHLDIPRHYFHFTLDGMRRLLSARGLETLYVSHFSFEQDIFGWIQSICNRIGFPHNLLYDLLRTRKAKLGAAGGGLPQTLLMIALLPGVVAVSAALFLIDICLRRGGCMEIYARKEGAKG